MKKNFRLLALCVVQVGILHTAGICEESWKKIPLPSIEQSTFNSFGDSVGITAKGLRVYIDKYGKDGWLAGLHDTHCLDGQPSNIEIEASTRLRVCDVFLFAYLKIKSPNEEAFSSKSTFKERDIRIKKLLEDLDKLNMADLPNIRIFEP